MTRARTASKLSPWIVPSRLDARVRSHPEPSPHALSSQWLSSRYAELRGREFSPHELDDVTEPVVQAETSDGEPEQKDGLPALLLFGIAAGSIVFSVCRKAFKENEEKESSPLPGVLPPEASSTPFSTIAPASTSMWNPKSSPFMLTNGKQYCARVQLSGMQKMFANEQIIRSKLEDAGFANVSIWMTPEALPAALPAILRNYQGPFVRATWGGSTEQVNLPSEIADVWENVSP